MDDVDEEPQSSRNRLYVTDGHENGNRSTVRRASTPAPNELAIIPSRSQWPTYLRIALPLPYLPSDYEPSESSTKQRIFHPEFLRQQPPRPPAKEMLQIDNADWEGKQQSTRPRSMSTGSERAQFPANRHQQLSIGGIQDNHHSHLELVPYRDWTVISQNELRGEVVLYNPDTRMVTVQTQSPPQHDLSSVNPMDIVQRIVECPYCHRAFDSSEETNGLNQPAFMDRNYFRLLSPIPTQVLNNRTPAVNGNRASNATDPSGEGTTERSAHNLKANAFNQGYYKKFFIEEKKLGRGLRGSVYLCQHELDGVSLGQYAIKKVAVGDNHPWLVRMLREVHLMEQLRHPNIVNYKHSWLEYHQFSSFGPEVPCLFILMECANGGNLEEYIEPEFNPPDGQNPNSDNSKPKPSKISKRERIKQQFREQQKYEQLLKQQEQSGPGGRLLSLYEIWSFFFDILDGLAHLHRHNIVHRDLKPPNLLVKYDDRDVSRTWIETIGGMPTRRRIPRILISDFGECEVLDELTERDRTGATGTLEFMAPELIRLDDHGKYLQEFSPKADMWSLGMVLFYLCYSRLPYHHIYDVDKLKDEILSFDKLSFPSSRNNGQPPTQAAQDHIPPELKHLIRALLSLNPEARPSCDEILEKIGHLKPKAPNAQNGTSEASTNRQSFQMPRMRLGNALGIQNNQPAAQPYRTPAFPTDSPAESNVSGPISEPTGAGVKIERIPSDMGYAEKVLSNKKADEADEDITMADSEDFYNNNEMNGARKRRRSLGMSWDVGEEGTSSPYTSDKMSDGARDDLAEESEQLKQLLLESPDLHGDAHQQSRLAMRALALVPESHRELTEFWMRSASEVDWRKLLKAVSAILKVATATYPCYPYMMSPTTLYPMVAMALLDMYTQHASQSLALLMLHLAWVIVMTLIGSRTCTMR